MKKRNLIIWISVIILLLILLFFGYSQITGKAILNDQKSEKGRIGPTAEEQSCMMQCMGCSSPGASCTGNQEECMSKCNVKIPEMTEEEECVYECSKIGCDEYDFECQNKNQDKCDKECGMVKEPDEVEMSAEQLCITNCVESESPGTRCGASQSGETGNEVCQRCAASCVHLYEGPCLDDEKLKAKQKDCETCEHCYGEPIMGDSGQGWECIVDVKCFDASSEFGDNPGTGPGIGQEGFIANVGEAVGNVFEGIGNFFKGIFGGEKSEDTSSDTSNSDSVSP